MPDENDDNNDNVDDLKSGPFSLLYEAVKENYPILINVRNNHKYLARVKAYDRHMNLYVYTALSLSFVHEIFEVLSWLYLYHVQLTPKFSLLRWCIVYRYI